MSFQINGANGKYDGKVLDESIKYGRNAVENNLNYMESPIKNDNQAVPPVFDFSPSEQNADKNLEKLEKYVNDNDAYLKSLPPLEFEYRYMPNIVNGKIDTKAVLGAAYEEMGQVKELSVKEFEKRYLIDDTMTAEPLDINKDGKIDIAEYSTNIIAADLLSKDSTNVADVDGTINAKGLNAVLEYTKKSNAAAASKLYTNIYNTFNLGSTLNEI